MSKKKILYALVVIFFSFFLVFAFPKYINAQACNTGDGNGDGNVDGFDYVIWWQNFNQNVQGAQNGDFNCNGYVDGFDYVIWWQNFGTVGNTPTPGDRIRVTYSESNEDFANPERGFMRQSRIWPDQAFSSSKISIKDPADSLVWIYFMLENYRDPRDGKGVTLPDYQGKLLEPRGSGRGLDTIKAAFDEARRKGLKLIIRFTYNAGPGSTSDPNQTNPDVPIDLVLQHINQLGPVITQNSDVIAAVQAGFVGHWGEWHSSKYLHQHRKTVVDALLNAIPKQRMIQIRYPRYKEIYYGGPITESEAFSESSRSRTAHQNDCFLAGTNDGGTYKSNSSQKPEIRSTYCDGQDEVACWMNFVAEEGRFTPIGGETCQIGSSSTRTSCSNALYEMGMLHWSFLNNGFYGPILDGWTSQGCMPEIRRRLGYRLVLKEALIPRSIRPGGTINLDVTLTNKGFAAMYNPRPVYLVLEGPNRYEILLSSVDPRRWAAGGNSTMSVNARVPTNVTPGTYKLGLWIPDASSSLRNNTAYAVRLANTNVWDASTGVNFLTSNFQVQAKTAVLSKTTASKLSPKQILEKWLVSTLDQNGDGRLNLLDVSLTF